MQFTVRGSNKQVGPDLTALFIHFAHDSKFLFLSYPCTFKMVDCYSLHLGVIEVNYADLPCENVVEVNRNVTCCVRGSACMGNGICQNSNGHGYYTADCTDPTMQDPACQTRCGQKGPLIMLCTGS